MPESENAPQGADAGAKLKVFISYSRKDQSIANELLSGLEACGFEAYLDKEDIAPGEPWEERLGRLIRDADTVVFVISPHSVASKHCGWEVDETVRLAKRLLPVVWQPVPDAEVPAALNRLNYIFFSGGNSFAKSLGDLARALRVDLDWIREHSRFGDLAGNWEARGKPEGLLLRGSEIDEAKVWLAKRPKDAPQITTQQQAFIDASIRAAADEFERRAALVWRAKVGTIAAAVVFAIGAAVSTYAWFQTNRARAELAERVLELRAANLRLDRKIALRVAPSGSVPYYTAANWYQIASDYSGGIVKVEHDAPGKGFVGTGFIVRGSALHKPWGNEPVFVTASFIFGAALRVDEARGSFPGLDADNPRIKFGEVLWERSMADGGEGVMVLRVKGALPFGAKPIEKVRVRDFEELSPMGGGAATAPGSPRPLATIGFGAVGAGFALFLNQLVGIHETSRQGRPLHLAYTYVTEGGLSGSPVFDIETGELVAVHQSRLDAGHLGLGASIANVVAAIEADLGKAQ